jgi:hypothetical protein
MYTLLLFVCCCSTIASTFAGNATSTAHEITGQLGLFSSKNKAIDVEAFETIVESLFTGIVNEEDHAYDGDDDECE